MATWAFSPILNEFSREKIVLRFIMQDQAFKKYISGCP